MSTPEHLLAFGFGIGLAPKAPGTFGSLLGVPLLMFLLLMPWQAYAATCALLLLVGIWASQRSAQMLRVHDYPGIVIDEIVGLLIAGAVLLPPFEMPVWPQWLQLGAVFLLFRVFDIWKPWPIRWLDRNIHGGLGIMIDDVLAGVMAGALLWGAGKIPFEELAAQLG